MSERRSAVLVYGLLLVSSLVSSAFVPVAPTFARELSLSDVQLGASLAAATVPLLLAAGHLGALGDRVSGRALTVLSGALLALTAAAHALAVDFATLLAVRLLFGLGQAILWTAGLAWLATLRPRRQSRALSATISVAGLGVALGPAYGGVLADTVSLGAPFVIGGAAMLAITVALVRTPAVAYVATEPEDVPLRTTLRLVGAHRALLGATVALVLSGAAGGVVNLVVPLQLEQNGLTATAVGITLTLSTMLFAAGAALIARLGDRAASLRASAAAALLLAAALALVVVSSSTAATVLFLVLRVPGWVVLSTAPYALIAVFAGGQGLGYGAVIGIATQLWAAAASLAPVVAGAALEQLGAASVYIALAAVAVAAGAWLLAQPPVRPLATPGGSPTA